MTEEQLITKYSQKIRELNELLDSGMISQAEYEELVQDFTDIETIRDDIKEEDMKIKAAKIIDAISHLIKIL
jgi:inosine/xanthosine triphosphate pyrophosphatase family protein